MAQTFKSNGVFYLREPSDYINSKALSANTQERETIPSGYNFMQILSNQDIYVKFGDNTVEATVPGDTSDGSSSELNGGAYMLTGQHTHVSVISEFSSKVTFSYYKL
jgi:sRNA-binding protein